MKTWPQLSLIQQTAEAENECLIPDLPGKWFIQHTKSCCGSQLFYHKILQRNYRKMTKKWSFFHNSFVKFRFITQFIYTQGPFLWTTKHSVIKGLHCIHVSQWTCPIFFPPIINLVFLRLIFIFGHCSQNHLVV